jgi:predicted metal-dependent RNase
MTDIYTGGISRKISRIYDYSRFVVRCEDTGFELSGVPQQDLYDVENPDDFFKYPCVVLASSGMMIEGTASFRLAEKWLRQKNSAIFTVGYMEKGTPGYVISSAEKGARIRLSKLSQEINVKCAIKRFRFSAHSLREDLIKVVEKHDPENVILVHGDSPSINWVGAAILKDDKKRRVFAAELGKKIRLNS